jgi:glutamate/tyrosine decarboxylase-like PLP-dependent enzyme
MVPSLASHLDGIGEADSITCDAHKFFSVSMGAGMFFCRHPDSVRAGFAVQAPYVLDSIVGDDDPYASTPQWSRRFIGLKLLLTLAELGASGMAAMIAAQAAMGDRLRVLLRARGFTTVSDTPLPLVCFTHPRLEDGSTDAGKVLAQVYTRGRVWLSEAVFGGRRVFRACITSYRTGPQDLELLVDEVSRALETE